MAALASTGKLREALSELPDAARYVWIDPVAGLVAGNFPDATHGFDFAAEHFKPISRAANQGKRRESLLGRAGRVRAISRIETPDVIYEVGSATQLLVEGLNIVERMRPGTVARLAAIKGRSKRPVSPTREGLYDYPHPPEHSARLDNGFFVATNNKAREAIGFLEQAIQIAGLEREVVLHVRDA